MVRKLNGSKHGEGVGGPMSETDDPNSPSFDPATHKTSTDEKIKFLLNFHTIGMLSDWEKSFLMDVYGRSPLSRKQHVTVWKIYKQHTEPTR